MSSIERKYCLISTSYCMASSASGQDELNRAL